MTHYLISFNQQWVGEHSEAWFAERGTLARAVVEEMRAAGVLVFAGGLEDAQSAIRVELDGMGVTFRPSSYGSADEFTGGLTIVDAPDLDTAKMWAGKIAQACGWPQELRAFGG